MIEHCTIDGRPGLIRRMEGADGVLRFRVALLPEGARIIETELNPAAAIIGSDGREVELLWRPVTRGESIIVLRYVPHG